MDAAKVRCSFKSLLGKDIELVGWGYLGGLPNQALGKSYGDRVRIRVEYRTGNGGIGKGENYTLDLGRLGDTGTLTDLERTIKPLRERAGWLARRIWRYGRRRNIVDFELRLPFDASRTSGLHVSGA